MTTILLEMLRPICITLFVALAAAQKASLTITHYTNNTVSTSLKENSPVYHIVSGESNHQLDVEINEDIACRNSTCVRKCCAPGKYFSLYPLYGCFDLEEEDPEFVLEFRRENGRPTKPDKPVQLLYKADFKTCTPYGLLPEHREAVLLSDGRLYTAYEDMYRDRDAYCIDVIRRDSKNFGTWPVICYDRYVETSRSLFQFYTHATCLVLSSACLLVIITCHVALPKLRDLAGLCLLSHVSSLLVADVCLVSVILNTSISINLCVFLGVAIHSSLLSTYMWLTVMCFDIWRYVRLSVKGIPSHLLQQQERRLFGLYCAVVWGSITIITCITCTLQFLPRDALPDYVIRPHFGVNRCFIIDTDLNLFLYFFSLLAVLCVLNVTFVGKTVRHLYDGGAKICCFQKDSSLASRAGTFNNKFLDLFWQRLQMFVMTTMVWATEVLSWKIPPKEMWDVTDLLNTLQGVILLIIFLSCKRRRKLIQSRVRELLGKPHVNAHKTQVPYGVSQSNGRSVKVKISQTESQSRWKSVNLQVSQGVSRSNWDSVELHLSQTDMCISTVNGDMSVSGGARTA